MSEQIVISTKVLSAFLDELSASNGSVDADAEIIQGIINGWIRAGDKDALKALARRLMNSVKEIEEVGK